MSNVTIRSIALYLLVVNIYRSACPRLYVTRACILIPAYNQSRVSKGWLMMYDRTHWWTMGWTVDIV